MSGAGSGYDFNPITFSPDGRQFQVEYATKAVEKDSLALGVKCKDGILLAAEKNLTSTLLTPGGNPRIFWINDSIACATIGHRPDCYSIVEQSRNRAETFTSNFGIKITVPQLASEVSQQFHLAHYYQAYRPFGCTVIFASYKDDALYAIEPSGAFYGYFASCFGKNSNLARAELQKTEWKNVTVREAVPEVARIIKSLHESQFKKWEIEMFWLCEETNGRPQKVPEDVFQSRFVNENPQN